MTSFAPSTPGHLRVDIWSDIACPWCYVGKRRLESALADFPHADEVEVVWHSFELDPQAPLDTPQSMAQLLAGKYGRSIPEAQGMIDGMTRTAAGEGLTYDLNGAHRTNTFMAHQLIHLAATRGLQGAMKERLLRAYMTEREHVGQVDTLVRLAQEHGLDAAEVREALTAGTHADAVRQDEAQAHALGITGVPFFVLGGRYGVSGAQSPEVLRGALDQVWAETHPAPLVRLDAPAAEGCEDGACEVPVAATTGTRRA